MGKLPVLKKFNFMFFVFLNLKLVSCFNSVLSFDWILGESAINLYCYIASAETKRDWLIHGHVALDKCNLSLGQ